MPGSHFTLEEANGMLPWLTQALKAIALLHAQVERLQKETLVLVRQAGGNGGPAMERQIDEKRKALEAAAKELDRHIRQVTERGVILRDPERGLVDLPSYRQGKEVYLCWLLGEPSIMYWHDLDTGFASRQLL